MSKKSWAVQPIAFLLTGGNVYDGIIAEPLVGKLPPARKLLADKAYDSGRLRTFLEDRGTMPVIPNKCNRLNPFPFRKKIYRHRNKIERMFCRLKDARRVATRYDKLAGSFLSTVCLMATIYFWLN